MKSKKGAVLFSIMLVVFMVILLLYAWSLLMSKYKAFNKNIGERQFSLIRTYQEAEKALFYIDQSAKYAAYQAIYGLANNGGHYSESDCGSYLGASLWVKSNKENGQVKIEQCNPSEQDLVDNFGQIFDEILTEYLVEYPKVSIPAYYDYSLSGNLEVEGKSKEPIIMDILDISPQKPKSTLVKVSGTPSEIYQRLVNADVPPILRVPTSEKSGTNIKVIEDNHPEVLAQYAELCRRIGIENPPGVCTSPQKKCCITNGYRHPAYNKKIEGAARNSAHQYAMALDINAGSIKEQIKLAEANEMPTRLFTRVAIYPDSTHVHFDLMPLKGEYAVAYMILSKKTGKTLATANSMAELESKATKLT